MYVHTYRQRDIRETSNKVLLAMPASGHLFDEKKANLTINKFAHSHLSPAVDIGDTARKERVPFAYPVTLFV